VFLNKHKVGGVNLEKGVINDLKLRSQYEEEFDSSIVKFLLEEIKKQQQEIEDLKESLKLEGKAHNYNIEQLESEIGHYQQKIERLNTPRPIEEWGEDYRDCLWWSFPIVEPPYLGTPFDADFPEHVTHFTKFLVPEEK
jgi:hypothetical protein